MKIKLLALASWTGLLISTISEYGFGEDFPLTPLLWLMIAAGALLFAAAHTAIGSRIDNLGKRGTGIYVSGNVPPRSDVAISISDGHTSSQISDRSQRISQDKGNGAGGSRSQTDSGVVIVTAGEAIPVIIFLGPAATRGPPRSDNQILRMLGRPARHFCAAPPPSEIDLRDSLTARNTTPVSPDQRMI